MLPGQRINKSERPLRLLGFRSFAVKGVTSHYQINRPLGLREALFSISRAFHVLDW